MLPIISGSCRNHSRRSQIPPIKQQSNITIKRPFSENKQKTKSDDRRSKSIKNSQFASMSSINNPKQDFSEHEKVQSKQQLQEIQQYGPYDKVIAEIREFTYKFRQDEQNISELVAFLSSFNPFFKKLSEVMIQCLFRIGRLVFVKKGQKLFLEGRQCKNLYLVLCGKILLENGQNNYKSYVINGQSLCEEVLFQQNQKKEQWEKTNSEKKYHKDQAIGCYKSCLLRIKIKQYCCLEAEFYKAKLKKDYILLQNLLRTQYLHKRFGRSISISRPLKKKQSIKYGTERARNIKKLSTIF